MELENLIEILKVWNIANGNHNMIAMLKGEKSVDEYITGVFFNSEENLKELNEDLEKEKAKERPNEFLIEHYAGWIKKVEAMRKRLALYCGKHSIYSGKIFNIEHFERTDEYRLDTVGSKFYFGADELMEELRSAITHINIQSSTSDKAVE